LIAKLEKPVAKTKVRRISTVNNFPEYVVLTVGNVTLLDIKQIRAGRLKSIDPAVKCLGGEPFVLKDGFDEETVAAQFGIPYDEDCRHGNDCLEEGFRAWIETHVAPVSTICAVIFGKELAVWKEDREAYAFLENIFDGADLVWGKHWPVQPNLQIARLA
jgi:hypothetical protein